MNPLLIDWKGVTRTVAEMHRSVGGSAIHIGTGHNVFSLPAPVWLYAPKAPRLEVDGPSINAKQLREWLFQYRALRCLHRPGATVWTLYDPRASGGVSVCGVGTLIHSTVASRLSRGPVRPEGEATYEFVDLVKEAAHG